MEEFENLRFKSVFEREILAVRLVIPKTFLGVQTDILGQKTFFENFRKKIIFFGLGAKVFLTGYLNCFLRSMSNILGEKLLKKSIKM